MSIWIWVAIGVLLLIGISIAGGAWSQFVSTYEKKDGIVSVIELTASDFAKNALAKNNIPVEVVRTSGKFSDYYSHRAKHVALSDETYSSGTVVALGIASHEVGHAVTDYTNSVVYRLHSILRKITSILNKLVYLVLIAGIVLYFFDELVYIANILMYIVLGIVALSYIFKFLTVSNERAASKIGIQLLRDFGMPKDEVRICKKVLNAALLTYIGEIFMPIVKFLRLLGLLFDVTLGRLFK